MEAIRNENDYQEVKRRIDQFFFETDENTPIDDPRMKELDTYHILSKSLRMNI